MTLTIVTIPVVVARCEGCRALLPFTLTPMSSHTLPECTCGAQDFALERASEHPMAVRVARAQTEAVMEAKRRGYLMTPTLLHALLTRALEEWCRPRCVTPPELKTRLVRVRTPEQGYAVELRAP